MSPDAADPRVQDRIAAGTQVLDRAREIYGKADLDLIIAYWTLRPAGLEFREYYE